MAGPYYTNSKIDNVDFIEASDLEAIETGFANVDADKSNKKVPVTTGDFATLDANGDLADSGKTPPAGEVVGTTDTQTLTNKTLSSPVITGNTTTDGLIDGRDVATDGTKLDGIESGATADQTDAEIKTAYENNANTNAFTDADHSKLDGIEAGATADQSDAEIKTAYESNANTNAFTDAEQTKLSGIEAGATADQTAAEIKTLYESNANTNAFTDADHSKLDGIEASADVTDTTNVAAAGALMDSELTNITAVKAIDQGVATTDDVTFNTTTTKAQYLEALTNTLTGTAVATHIYIPALDDSDGGAWRYRTQHTSWYQETLNTATRGKTREFPAVAGIVVEDAKVTIYDMTDPDHAMWMVFETAGGSYYWISGYNDHDLRAAAMVNAEMVVVNYSGYNHGGVIRVRFLQDDVFATIYAGNKRGVGGLVNRNTSTNWVTVDDGNYIVSNAVNDVALTVLPNAPIDAATGLPVPTIYVHTAAGTSRINTDGTVDNFKYTWTTVPATNGGATEGSFSMVMRGTSYGGAGTGLVVFDSHAAAESASSNFTSTDREYHQASTPAIALASGDANNAHVQTSDIDHAIGNGNLLCLLHENPTTPAEGSVAYITSNSNSGWMHGDIKGAWLADTDDTDVTGVELVTNGTFDTDTTGWTPLSANTQLSVVSGELKVLVVTGVAFGTAYQDLTVTPNAKYLVSGYVSGAGTASNNYLQLGTTSSASAYHNQALGVSPVNFIYEVTPTESPLRISLLSGIASGQYDFWDNISVKLADQDRSVNGNGLQINGTITKTPVATGAELVAYSGFSASDYLEQPYNADLDFADEMSLMFWMKNTATGDSLLTRGSLTRNVSTSFEVYIDGGYDLRFVLSSNGTTEVAVEAADKGTVDAWQHVCCYLKDGYMSIYVNGRHEGSTSFSGNIHSQATDKNSLYVGGGCIGGPYAGSVSGIRISATAPSAEEIKRIYNSEKHLFNENAAATLAGTSDAITALDYDKVTQELHAGTSGGRSVFNGLVRVDEDVDATSQSLVDIAAKDGMLLEGK